MHGENEVVNFQACMARRDCPAVCGQSRRQLPSVGGDSDPRQDRFKCSEVSHNPVLGLEDLASEQAVCHLA